MTAEFHRLIHSHFPLKIESRLLDLHINQEELQKIEEGTQSLLYYTGEEYSAYIEHSYQTNRGCEDIFKEKNRYRYHLDEMQFFLTKDSGFAASTLLTNQAKFFGGLELWDIRSFVGKKSDSSCLHFDWNSCPILLINTYGEKRFDLYPPEASSSLQGYGNFSFKKDLPPTHQITIQAGEALVIPPFWWHQAHYLTNAKSLSLRFAPLKSNAYLIKNLYPSWKFLQLASLSPQEEYDFALLLNGPLSRSTSALELFENVEQVINQKIAYPHEDHPFYSRFILDYLSYYMFNKVK